jgi:CHAD domain-containing protein
VLRKDVRRVTRAFGAVRELDVATGHFDEAAATTEMSAVARSTTRRILQEQRAVALRQARATLTSTRLRRLQAHLDELTVATTADAAAVKAAMAARIVRRARGARKAVMGTGVVYMPERLHAVRIAVKRLRYALEAGQEARGARATAQLMQLKAIQDLLGRAHDLHVLAERLREVQVTVVQRSRATARDQAALARALDRECRALHAAFMSRRNGLVTLSTSLLNRASAPRARSVA